MIPYKGVRCVIKNYLRFLQIRIAYSNHHITLAHSFSQRYEKGYDAVINALAGVVDREMRQIISPSWHGANFLQ